MQRKLTASHALEESEMSGWENFENVQRVKQHLSENQFDELFPIRDKDFYTYNGFLRAVAKFPAFCNDFNEETDDVLNIKDIDQVCKRELSTLFAHIAYESGKNDPWFGVNLFMQGLYHKADKDC
jgi:hypothetical protein